MRYIVVNNKQKPSPKRAKQRNIIGSAKYRTKEEWNAYLKKWRKKNPKKHRAIQRRAVIKNRKKINEYVKTWRKKNPDKVMAIEKRYLMKRKITQKIYRKRMKKKKHGGKRPGAGRPAKEPTKVIRVPEKMVKEIRKLIEVETMG